MGAPDDEVMDPQDRMRVAAGETEHLPPPPEQSDLDRLGAIQKDETYSPSSEDETRHKQEDPTPETIDDDIDLSDVRVVPGTGGPDDAGDVDVDPADLNMP